MKRNPVRAVLCACVLACLPAWPQEPAQPPKPEAPPADQPQTPAPGPPKTTASIPPPREVPSEVNTGRGLSFELFYWPSRLNTALRTGNKFSSTTSTGDLDIPYSKPRAYGGMLSIPAAKTSMVRISYFQMPTQSGGTVAPTALTLFDAGTANAGDLVFTSTRVSELKVSLDYLTYFIKRGGSELRIKTLWEVQRVGITTDVTVFNLQTDGTFLPKSAGHDFNIIIPSVGVGLEHTVGRHFRWEAKASGMMLGGQKSALGDGEAILAFRFGRFELIGGGKAFYFRTSKNDNHFVKGSMFGPYAGIRYYFGRQRPAQPPPTR